MYRRGIYLEHTMSDLENFDPDPKDPMLIVAAAETLHIRMIYAENQRRGTVLPSGHLYGSHSGCARPDHCHRDLIKQFALDNEGNPLSRAEWLDQLEGILTKQIAMGGPLPTIDDVFAVLAFPEEIKHD